MTFTQGWEGPKVYASQLGSQPVRTEWSMPTPEVGIIPLRPLGTGDILGGAFKAVRYNPLVMFGLTILVVLVTQLLATLATYVFGQQLGLGMLPFDLNDPAALPGLGYYVSILAGSAVSGLTAVVVNMGLMFATAQAVAARRVKPAEALRHMGRRMWPALVLAALEVTMAVLAIAAGVGLMMLASSGGAEAAIGVSLLFIPLAGVPALWITTKLMLAPCAIAVEELGPIRAIARSWQLTRGLFWHILGISLLVNLIVGLAASTVTQVFSFATMLFAITSAETWAMLAATTASSIVSVGLTLPLTSAATTLLYVDARIRREGFDITLSEAMYQ